jgi:hypothetical protein
MRALSAAFMVAFALSANGVEVAGVKFDDKTRLAPNSPELVLNGAGLRTRFFVKVYAGGLYLPQTVRNAADVINGSGPRRVQLGMLREVSAKQFNEALIGGLEDNHSAEDLQRLKPQIDQLSAVIEGIGQLKQGDVVNVDFLPETGTRIQVNGESKGAPIAGADLYRALLRIWLGEKPVDSDLKTGMLGGS